MSETFRERARLLVARCTRRPPGAVTAEASIGTLEGWDSIAHISIVLAVEEEIGRTLTSDEIISVTSVERIAALLATAGGA